MLIIVALETNSKEGSDYFYFKSIVNYFYKERGVGISIKSVFMNGKGNYNKIENKIRNFVKQYDGKSQVIYFCDIDSSDLNFNQKQMNEEINNYCKEKEYEIIWYNRTVEEVLIGNIVENNKTQIARNYFIKNEIQNIDINKLSVKSFDLVTRKKSNVLYILDKYLVKK